MNSINVETTTGQTIIPDIVVPKRLFSPTRFNHHIMIASSFFRRISQPDKDGEGMVQSAVGLSSAATAKNIASPKSQGRPQSVGQGLKSVRSARNYEPDQGIIYNYRNDERHFSTLCENNFLQLEKSSRYKSQKFGARQSSKHLVKLGDDKIEQFYEQLSAAEQAKKYAASPAAKPKKTPASETECFGTYEGHEITAKFRSIQIFDDKKSLLDELSTKKLQIVIKYPKSSLKALFTQFTSVKDGKVDVDLDGFRETYFDTSTQDEKYDDLEAEVKTVEFPRILYTRQDTHETGVLTLSKEQITTLLNKNFANLSEYLDPKIVASAYASSKASSQAQPVPFKRGQGHKRFKTEIRRKQTVISQDNMHIKRGIQQSFEMSGQLMTLTFTPSTLVLRAVNDSKKVQTVMTLLQFRRYVYCMQNCEEYEREITNGIKLITKKFGSGEKERTVNQVDLELQEFGDSIGNLNQAAQRRLMQTQQMTFKSPQDGIEYELIIEPPKLELYNPKTATAQPHPLTKEELRQLLEADFNIEFH